MARTCVSSQPAHPGWGGYFPALTKAARTQGAPRDSLAGPKSSLRFPLLALQTVATSPRARVLVAAALGLPQFTEPECKSYLGH